MFAMLLLYLQMMHSERRHMQVHIIFECVIGVYSCSRTFLGFYYTTGLVALRLSKAWFGRHCMPSLVVAVAASSSISLSCKPPLSPARCRIWWSSRSAPPRCPGLSGEVTRDRPCCRGLSSVWQQFCNILKSWGSGCVGSMWKLYCRSEESAQSSPQNRDRTS